MTPVTHVLVVDDDESIRKSVRQGLVHAGMSAETAASGDEAFAAIADRAPDVVVLDIMMPGIDGLEVCRRLREADPHLPIIMLTARDAIADRVIGLETGADDYLVKPFAFAELLARIKVLLRRRDGGEQKELRFADLRLDLNSHEAYRGQRAIVLTSTEFNLLRLFMLNPRRVLTRDRIYDSVWGYEFLGESKVIEVYISQLRQKLESGGEARLIQTMRGTGYVLREES